MDDENYFERDAKTALIDFAEQHGLKKELLALLGSSDSFDDARQVFEDLLREKGLME